MRGKTVILVTHALHFLYQADYICHFGGGNGKITEEGEYADLVAKNGAFSELMREFGHKTTEKEDGEEMVTDESITEHDEKGPTKIAARLIQKELRRTGEVKNAG